MWRAQRLQNSLSIFTIRPDCQGSSKDNVSKLNIDLVVATSLFFLAPIHNILIINISSYLNPQMASARIETAKSFLEGFADLSSERHLSVRSEDCIHCFAPASLESLEPKDNASFAAHLTRLREVMVGFSVTPKEMIDSANENTVTVWATSEAKFHPELQDSGLLPDKWAYRGEYIFILSMDPTGKKIHRIVEFLDSKATERLFGLVERAKENRRRLGEKS
jgi:hypothetical protein